MTLLTSALAADEKISFDFPRVMTKNQNLVLKSPGCKYSPTVSVLFRTRRMCLQNEWTIKSSASCCFHSYFTFTDSSTALSISLLVTFNHIHAGNFSLLLSSRMYLTTLPIVPNILSGEHDLVRLSLHTWTLHLEVSSYRYIEGDVNNGWSNECLVWT